MRVIKCGFPVIRDHGEAATAIAATTTDTRDELVLFLLDGDNRETLYTSPSSFHFGGLGKNRGETDSVALLWRSTKQPPISMITRHVRMYSTTPWLSRSVT